MLNLLQPLQAQIRLKELKTIKIQSAFAFLEITKLADFHWKNADVSRTQGVCLVIYIFFWIFFR